jgi:predicted DNA-binding protein
LRGIAREKGTEIMKTTKCHVVRHVIEEEIKELEAISLLPIEAD